MVMTMRALIISCDNIYLTPYISLYERVFENKKIEFDVIYWDKNKNEDKYLCRYIRYTSKHNTIGEKTIGYINFRKIILKQLKEIDYQLVVCLHTIGNFLITDKLITKYRRKYIFDVRDYSLEKYALVRLIEKILTRYSALNVISSEGFKNFLPNAQYEIAHNLPSFDYKKYREIIPRLRRNKIWISYIGLIRFMDQNKKIIDYFKNDDRFVLRFAGTGALQLQEYCKKVNATNVELIDTFAAEDTLRYYEDTDIVMNLYGSGTPLLDYALSNKLYYSAMLCKPILVCKNTYMEKISKKYGFGVTIDLHNELSKDNLFEYMQNYDRKELAFGCDAYIEIAKTQQKHLVETLENTINNIAYGEENCENFAY